MKKIFAALLALFGIGVLPMLMGPTGGFPYTPTFGTVQVLNGGVALGGPSPSAVPQVTVTQVSAQFGFASTALDNTAGFHHVGPSNTDTTALQFQEAGRTPWEIYEKASTSDFRISANHTDELAITSAGVITYGGAGAWTLPKISSAQQATASLACSVAAGSVNMNGTCTYVSAGRYTFTFGTAYASNPVCTATIIGLAEYIYIAAISTTTVTVQSLNTSSVATDNTLMVNCIGF